VELLCKHDGGTVHRNLLVNNQRQCHHPILSGIRKPNKTIYPVCRSHTFICVCALNMMQPVRENIYEDADGYVSCDHLFNRSTAALHLHFNEGAWSHSKFKRYKGIFVKQILPFLRDKRYKEVYATPFEGDIKAQKLIAMFGFKEFARKQGHVLMKREI
jgi:hypothetical protein